MRLRSFEWDSMVGWDCELHFLCDVWKVVEDKAVWFKCSSIMARTETEECALPGGTGFV